MRVAGARGSRRGGRGSSGVYDGSERVQPHSSSIPWTGLRPGHSQNLGCAFHFTPAERLFVLECSPCVSVGAGGASPRASAILPRACSRPACPTPFGPQTIRGRPAMTSSKAGPLRFSGRRPTGGRTASWACAEELNQRSSIPSRARRHRPGWPSSANLLDCEPTPSLCSSPIKPNTLILLALRVEAGAALHGSRDFAILSRLSHGIGPLSCRSLPPARRRSQKSGSAFEPILGSTQCTRVAAYTENPGSAGALTESRFDRV